MRMEEVSCIVKLSDICRVCLMQVNPMKYLLDNDEEVPVLIAMLESIVNIEFQVNNVLPAYICSECQNKLKAAYEFQQLCLKSQEAIKQIILTSADEARDLTEQLEPKIEAMVVDIDTDQKDLIATLPQFIEGHQTNGGYCEVSYQNDLALKLAINVANTNLDFTRDNTTIKVDDVKTNMIEVLAYHNDDTETKPVCTEFEFVCDMCGRGFKMKSYLAKHIRHCGARKISSLINGKNYEHEADVKIMNSEFCDNSSLVNDGNSEKKNDDKKTANKRIPARKRRVSHLKQYPIEKVNEAIQRLSKKFLENNKCGKCHFYGSNARALTLHITHIHKDIKDRWCPQCNLEFNDLQAHQNKHLAEDMVCEFCSKLFRSKGHLVEHLRCHSVSRPYPCEICTKSFISSRHLKVHMKTHTKKSNDSELQGDSECKQGKDNHNEAVKNDDTNCLITASSSTETSHIDDTADGKNDYLESDELSDSDTKNYCKDCNKKVRSLKLHLDKFHPEGDSKEPMRFENVNLCNVCGKQFKSSSHLRTHMRVHTGETPYQCSYCDKKVLTRNHLVVHERTHTGEKPYVCSFCGKCFAQSTVLATHMRLHTGRPIECSVCEKRFCRKGELKLHMRKHTGEKPYVCPDCGKGFIQKSHLMEHIKTHTDERPFQCQFCDRAFKQHSSLKTHLCIHLGHKPYKCSECSYACRQSYSLTQHMWVHGIDNGKLKKKRMCLICNKSFNSISLLASHNESEHSNNV